MNDNDKVYELSVYNKMCECDTEHEDAVKVTVLINLLIEE